MRTDVLPHDSCILQGSISIYDTWSIALLRPAKIGPRPLPHQRDIIHRMRTPTRSELEASLEAYFLRVVRLTGGMAIKLAPTQKGLPDRLVLLPGGRTYLVELKTESGVPSPSQRVWHQRVASLGHRVATLYGRNGIDAWIREGFAAPASDHTNTRPSRKKDNSNNGVHEEAPVRTLRDGDHGDLAAQGPAAPVVAHVGHGQRPVAEPVVPRRRQARGEDVGDPSRARRSGDRKPAVVVGITTRDARAHAKSLALHGAVLISPRNADNIRGMTLSRMFLTPSFRTLPASVQSDTLSIVRPAVES